MHIPYYRILLLGAALCLGNSSAFAQDPQPLSLKECINYSLKNNLTNVIYDNQVKLAEQQKIEGLSSYLPQINASGTLDDNIKRQVTVIPAGVFSPVDTKIQFGNQYNTSVNLQADQVIYDQTIIAGLKANAPNIELARLNRLRNEDDIIYTTAANYYQVLIYKEQIKLLAENEKKLSGILTVQKLQYEKGVITKVNYNRVQVTYNNILSQKNVAETNYSLAIARLKNAMGMPAETDLKVVDSVDYRQEVSISVNPDFNIKNKPDYMILEKNLRLSEIDLKRKRASVLPTLSAYARYGASAFGNDFEQSYNHWYDYSAIGLKLNVPIFGSLRRYSQITQSELNVMNSRQNLLINAENIRLQLQNSNTQLVSSFSNLQSNKNNLALAKDVFDDTSLQYEKGAAGLTDLLNADYAYKEAQSNYISSLLNYLIAKIELERSKGTIKQFVNQL